MHLIFCKASKQYMYSYGSLCTEFYDLDKPQAPPAALAFYAQKARDSRGRVLEPMCGSGRFLVPLIKAGLIVDGTDSSSHMIRACERRLAAEMLHADIYYQPIERLDLPHSYSLAFIPSGSIGLLESEDALRSALSAIRVNLDRGAPLLLEFSAPDDDANAPDATALNTRMVQCDDGSVISYMFSAHRQADSKAVLIRGRYVKSKNNEVICSEDENLVIHSYPPDRLRIMLCECGFAKLEFYSPADLPFLAESGCLLAEAR